MWHIELIDIGGDGLIMKTETSVETLPECEIVAGSLCCRHLGVMTVTLIHDEELVYEVKVNGLSVGWAVIRSL